MKKLCKLIFFVIKVTAIIALINHHVKLLARSLKGKKTEDELSHSYRFGNISYTKKGSGPAMLLLHNPVMNGSKEEWDALIEGLSARYTVFAPDLPGFGYSEYPSISYSSYLYASFINSFIEDVIKLPAIVMASGKSADFSICAASLKRANFEKLILISPNGFSEAPVRCKIRQAMKRFMEVPVYGTFVYNMIWLSALAIEVAKTLPNPNLPKTIKSSKFAMAALWSGELDLNIKDAAHKTGVSTFIALGNTDSISGIPAGIDTKLFCDADGLPHLGNDSEKFVDEVQLWLESQV